MQRPHVTGLSHLTLLFDYWLVTARPLMESQRGALLEADAKALCLG